VEGEVICPEAIVTVDATTVFARRVEVRRRPEELSTDAFGITTDVSPVPSIV
jgi:hypothetical protein